MKLFATFTLASFLAIVAAAPVDQPAAGKVEAPHDYENYGWGGGGGPPKDEKLKGNMSLRPSCEPTLICYPLTARHDYENYGWGGGGGPPKDEKLKGRSSRYFSMPNI